MDPGTILKREESAVTRRLAGETVILPVRHNVADLTAIYTLNETGGFVWEQLDGQRTVAQLVDAVTAMFAVKRGAAEDDVLALLADLGAEGLVREA